MGDNLALLTEGIAEFVFNENLGGSDDRNWAMAESGIRDYYKVLGVCSSEEVERHLEGVNSIPVEGSYIIDGMFLN